MAAVNQPSLEELVDNFCPGGCYGIEWAHNGSKLEHKGHFNAQWWIDAVGQKGLKGFYTTESTSYTFDVGQGLVGKAFKQQKPVFVKDLQDVDTESVMDILTYRDMGAFLRNDLAKKYGIRSAIFLPSQAGVLEVGSRATMESLPAYFASYAGPGMPEVATEAPAAKAPPAATTAPSQLLQKFVSEISSPSCCYAIEWELGNRGLVYKSHYNPEWRVEAVKKQGLTGLYTTDSMHYTFERGQGLVGRAFAQQEAIFVPNLQDLDGEAAKDEVPHFPDGWVFLRSGLARQYGIRSAVFLPTPTGVLEVGSTEVLASMQELFSGAGAEVSQAASASELLEKLTALAQ
mmetsp:Transcript_71339/g.231058  ORF Transcript_71339/g.231058 Transcript_71339/m.231058 type:complete len:345 (-) Transcript_71339:60-1094(-)